MTITYTGNLKLALPTTGTEAGTWGDVVNQQLTTLVDQSISGTVSLTSMTNADYTLTNGNGNAANEARYMALLVPSSLTLTAARNIIVPSTSKMYVVRNATTGGFSVVVKTSAGTGIEVPNGRTMLLYCDGTNVIVAFDNTNIVSQNGGQLAGLRNRIINGGMQVAQRGNVALANNTQVYGGADRWICAIGNFTTASGTAGQIGGQPTTSFSTGCLQSIQSFTSTGSGFVQFRQRIEVLNSYSLNGKTVTVSGTAYQDTGSTQSFDVALFKANAADNFATTTVISSSTKSAANGTVTNFTATTTLGSTDASNGIELVINFTAVGAVTNKNFYIGDIQLEVGSVATTFEQRPYGLELALCQRYTLVIPQNMFFGTGASRTGADKAYILIPTPVSMRATPAFTYTTITAYSGDSTSVLTSISSIYFSGQGLWLGATFSAAIGIVYGAVMLYTTTGSLIISAEL